MTMTMNRYAMDKQIPGPPQGPAKEHERRSLLTMPTHEIELSPTFLQALKQVAPKQGRRKLPYVLATLVLVAGVTVFVVPRSRSAITSSVGHLLHRHVAAAAAMPEAAPSAAVQLPSPAVSAPVPQDSAVIAPIVATPPAAPPEQSAPSSRPAAKPHKAPRKSQRRATPGR